MSVDAVPDHSVIGSPATVPPATASRRPPHRPFWRGESSIRGRTPPPARGEDVVTAPSNAAAASRSAANGTASEHHGHLATSCGRQRWTSPIRYVRLIARSPRENAGTADPQFGTRGMLVGTLCGSRRALSKPYTDQLRTMEQWDEILVVQPAYRGFRFLNHE